MCSKCSRMRYSILYSEVKPCVNVNSTYVLQLILFSFSRTALEFCMNSPVHGATIVASIRPYYRVII